MVVELKLFTWSFQISILALIFYLALIREAIVAMLAQPKLASNSLRVRGLNKEIYGLKKKAADLERSHEEEF